MKEKWERYLHSAVPWRVPQPQPCTIPRIQLQGGFTSCAPHQNICDGQGRGACSVCKFVAQPEISHEAAELILRNQAIRTDEKFPGIIHVSHQLALLHGHENVFFLHTVWCRQRWWCSEATEVSVRRIWRIPSESETQA